MRPLICEAFRIKISSILFYLHLIPCIFKLLILRVNVTLSSFAIHSKLYLVLGLKSYVHKNMARPKDKFRSQTFGDAFLDKSERERSRLKLTLAKQMQKDIGRYICLLDSTEQKYLMVNCILPFVVFESKYMYNFMVQTLPVECWMKKYTRT